MHVTKKGNRMKCARCNKEKGFPGRGVTLVKNGMIRGTLGMTKYDAVCNDCIVKVPIDDTTMKTREPGCDDELGDVPQTEW